MSNNKIYSVIKPALIKKIFRAELSNTSIDTSLSKDGVEQDTIDKLPFTEISSVNISLADFNTNEICITAENGKSIKLLSKSIGKIVNGKFISGKEDQTSEFNAWVSELHKIIIEKKLSDNIKFSEGSNGKTLFLAILAILCFFGMLASFSMGRISMSVTAITGLLLSTGLLFKIGMKRKYDPNNKVK